MNEEMDLNTKLDRLIEAVTAVVQKVDEQQARLDELDSTLYDGLIGPANDAIAENEYNNALSDFRTKYAEKLSGFEGPAKAITGDDSFDVFKEAFDNYNDGDYDFSPDEYVDKLTASLTEQIKAIKEAVADKEGVSEEDVEVKVDAKDGEVQVDVDNTDTEESPEENVKTEEVSEEESAEEGNDLKDFEKSLKEEADKDKESWIRG